MYIYICTCVTQCSCVCTCPKRQSGDIAMFFTKLDVNMRGIWGIIPKINRSSKIKSSVHCGAAGYTLVLVISYYYGLLLQKDVADIMDCGEMLN